jgi:flagellar hook-associated protein 3 FlgL
MAATDDGRSVFQSVQGSAKQVTTADAGNAGAGVFSDATVSDGKDYTVTFTGVNAQGNNQYQVSDGTTTSTANAQSDGTIAAGKLTMRVTGQPVAGDRFTVRQAQNTAPDVFAAGKDVIAALKAPASADAGADSARLLNALSTANVKITNAYDNILTVRSSVGSRLAELETLDASGAAQQLANQSYLSQLQDLDYAGAISEFTQRQTNLQATQQTFARLQGINLFNYLT